MPIIFFLAFRLVSVSGFCVDELFDLRIKEYYPPLSLVLHCFGLVTRAPFSKHYKFLFEDSGGLAIQWKREKRTKQ